MRTTTKALPRTTLEETQTLLSVIWEVWNAIVPDCGTVRSNAAALELCIDADRLTTFAHDPEKGRVAQDAWRKYAHDPKTSIDSAYKRLGSMIKLV
jgi:hypothetical protein